MTEISKYPNYTGPESSLFTASAPSNIALVKYWGKRDVTLQWPANDSISLTLSESRSITTARRISNAFDLFTIDGRTISSSESPDMKVFRHLNRVRANLGLNGALELTSRNTFPTGCGIASSASGFAALTLASAAALTGESDWDALAARGATRASLADWARMGSGSACRSMYDGIVKWSSGDQPTSQKITREFTWDHWNLADVIVVLSDKEKHTSSSEAHLAAWGSPLFAARLAGIPERIAAVNDAIRDKDLSRLGREIEADALEMHAVAMTGNPSVNYFSQDTENFISWARSERYSGRFPAWFTIDAGPNIHLICSAEDAGAIAVRIKKSWGNAKIIMDHAGQGPTIQRGHLEVANV